MSIDANLLLTAETLRLNPDVVSGQSVDGVFALKCVTPQTYLTVNARQWRVLNEFAQPKTVPEALGNCIRKRTCPALREFYELVLKAHQAGVLCNGEAAAVRRAALDWPASVRPLIALPVAAVAGAVMAVAFALRPPVEPRHWTDWLGGWAAACAALSLGQALAASVLRAGGGEIHRPRFHWRTGLPRFAVDLRDTCMTDRLHRFTVEVSRIVPLLVIAGAALWRQRTWGLLPLAVLLLQGWPLGGTPAGRILQLFRRPPRLDTDRRSLFAAPLSWRAGWRKAWKGFSMRAAIAQFTWGVAWTFAVGATALRLHQMSLGSVVGDQTHWGKVALGLGAGLAVTAFGGFAFAIRRGLTAAFREAWKRWRLTARRWRARPDPGGDEAAATALVRRSPLLQRLDPDTQAEIARRLRPYAAKAWRTLIRFDEKPAQVGFILSGAATVYRRSKTGRRIRFLRLAEGDVFGAHPLADPDHASLEVRTGTPLLALVLSADDFERLVVAKLGAAAVCNAVHRQAFLRQSALCARWRPTALGRFVELADTVQYPAGSKIIEAGQEVRGVHVLYEGRARALQGGKQVGRIRAGDFFGEISTLQGSAATADVEARDDCRCLVVDRLEFIRFMVRNHSVALQVEQVCSDRLGRAIFPVEARFLGGN